MAKETQNSNVVFKRKTTSFSMVANPIIDDKEISPAAGWLYVLIQRWITFNAEGFVCSKSFIASKYPSGYRMFNRAWDELKSAGYLKMYCQMNPRSVWSAELLDEPQPNTPHTYYLNAAGEVTSTNEDLAKKREEKQNSVSPKMTPTENEKFRIPQNDSNGNDRDGNDSNGNGGDNINTLVNDSFNTLLNTNQSINHSNTINIDSATLKKKTIDRLIDADTIKDIKDQIQYDLLLENYDDEFLNIIISCIAELYCANESMTFNNRSYAAELIRQRSLEIKMKHVMYVSDCFMNQKEKVHNVKKYLLTAIFNAPDTIDAYYTNAVIAAGMIVR